jgi:NAD-dependent deacetylase
MSLAEARRRIDATGASPRCACGGFRQAALISFGQRMPGEEMTLAQALAANADLFLVLGSSLIVQPAKSLPLVALHSGATLMIINRDETPLNDAAYLVIRKQIGAVFDSLSTDC